MGDANIQKNELRDAARAYDDGLNEGGEGYNPYRSEIERRENERFAADAKVYSATPRGRIDALYRRIDLECGSVAREWGKTEEIDALQSSLYAEIDAAFLETWTVDITKTRREAWNTMVRSGKFGRTGSGRIDFTALRSQETLQGWTADELKKAVALHGLQK
jgi:hypothetical protein